MTKEEFDKYFLDNQCKIQNFIRKLVKKNHLYSAGDIYNDVYVKLHRFTMSNPGKTIDDHEAILYKTVYNAFVSHYNNAKKIKANEETSAELLEAQATPKRQVYDTTLPWLKLESAIHRLSPVDREVVELCCIQGISYSSASKKLGLKIGTVKSRLSRAKAKMRKRVML